MTINFRVETTGTGDVAVHRNDNVSETIQENWPALVLIIARTATKQPMEPGRVLINRVFGRLEEQFHEPDCQMTLRG
jgi:hypothetical protein